MLKKGALLLLIALMPMCFPVSALAGQKLVVSAAASLTDAFTQLGKDFEKANPGVNVVFNFGGSGSLLQQISNGAPVDVFASADIETMDMARQKGVVDPSTVFYFAATKLVLVAPKESHIKVLKDLSGSSVKRIAVGNPDLVPVGRYTKEELERDGMWGGLEPKFLYCASVRKVLDDVTHGEVDAGFVYETDAAIVPNKLKLICELGGYRPVVYPIAAVTASKYPVLDKEFIKYILSERGQAVLARYGFINP